MEKVNKKEKQLAVKSVLSSKVLENTLVVVDSLDMKEIKTKEMVKVLLKKIKNTDIELLLKDSGLLK